MAIENPNFNPSPKAKFFSNKNWVSAHKDLIEKPELDLAFEFALLQMQRQLVREVGTDAAASFHQIAGANKLIHIFKTLAEERHGKRDRPNDNLEGNQR